MKDFLKNPSKYFQQPAPGLAQEKLTGTNPERATKNRQRPTLLLTPYLYNATPQKL